MSQPVVAGVDGSPRALAAVRVAAAEAAARHRDLRIVHALVWVPAGMDREPVSVPPVHDALWEQAADRLATAVEVAQAAAPGLKVTSEVIPGGAAPVLAAESGRAALLVVGDRGSGELAELLIGSVALHAATHGGCPVLVVRGTLATTGPVVVGVDGSAVSAEAVSFAAEAAALRRAELVAVHVRRRGDVTGRGRRMPGAGGEDEGLRVAAEAVAGLGAKYPDLRVESRAPEGSVRPVLADWSRIAQLVVVGSRGHDGLTGRLLGSTSYHLVHHAGCPVAVVKPARSLRAA